jgi:hypothetical protein
LLPPAAAARRSYSAQLDPLMQDFLAAAGGGAADQQGAGDEQIDDDIAIEGGARQLAPNATCPITTRPVRAALAAWLPGCL